MKVQAKSQIAYKGVGYKASDIFEVDDKDYPRYANNVITLPIKEIEVQKIEEIVVKELKKKEVKKANNKMLKKNKLKTK